jgi:hypothetical protein
VLGDFGVLVASEVAPFLISGVHLPINSPKLARLITMTSLGGLKRGQCVHACVPASWLTEEGLLAKFVEDEDRFVSRSLAPGRTGVRDACSLNVVRHHTRRTTTWLSCRHA